MRNIQDKEYLIFKGGGGKGNAYIGVIQALEDKGILPLRPDNTQTKVKGLAGTSAGAVTALGLAMGMSAEEIANESLPGKPEEAPFELNDFFKNDKAMPTKYRAVVIEAEHNSTKNKIIETHGLVSKEFKEFVNKTIAYKTDILVEPGKIDKHLSKVLGADLVKKVKKPKEPKYFVDTKALDIYFGGSKQYFLKFHLKPGAGDDKAQLIDHFAKIRKQVSVHNFGSTNKLFSISNAESTTVPEGSTGLKGFLFNALKSIVKVKNKDNNPILGKVAKARNFDYYLYNLLYDRGIFTGTAVRTYFPALIDRYMIKYHCRKYLKEFKGTAPKTPEDVDAGKYERKYNPDLLSFKEFKEITGVDFRVSSTNITAGKPVLFSVETAADFPVAEAVGMSMNIPILFKPIYVENNAQNKADMSFTTGMYGDGGMLNNFPFYAFYDKKKESEELYKNKTLGFSVYPGPDPDGYDPDQPYTDDPDYHKFVRDYFIKEEKLPPVLRPNDYQASEMSLISPHKLWGNTIIPWLGSLLDCFLDYATTSKYPEDYKNCLIEVYSYHISSLDFTPNKYLFDYVVLKAKEKTEKWLKERNDNSA